MNPLHLASKHMDPKSKSEKVNFPF